MEDLKICPFCGCRAATEKAEARGAVLYRIRCQSVYCRIHTEWYHALHDAISHWDRRSEAA
ncbi:MAG: Lar family restriction alleviation protein [Oscillospiraceae bacterium]|nr:Lar family restriction alleviation protein [Oscillospiraceae bacterium]